MPVVTAALKKFVFQTQEGAVKKTVNVLLTFVFKPHVCYLLVHHAFKLRLRSVKHNCVPQQLPLVRKLMAEHARQVTNVSLAYASLHFAF